MNRSKRGSALLPRTLARLAPLGILLAGCATTGLTRQDVVRQYDAIAQLANGLEDARGRDSALLAPNRFQEVKAQLDLAFEHAGKAQKQRANAAAGQGMAALRQCDDATARNRQVMVEVLDIRARATGQGAAVLFKEELADADQRFREASALLEQGEANKARKARPKLIETYAKLELRALKEGTVAAAKKAIATAEESDADDHAPKTLQYAREELRLALSVLDADRTRVAKSNKHARRALWLARRAHMVTNIIKHFKSQDFSNEDRVLWYQAQLQRVREALRDETLPFDQSNTAVIQALRSDALALEAVMKDIRRTSRMTQRQVRQLEHGLVAQRQAHEQELQKLLKSHERQLAALASGSRTRMTQAQREAQAQVDALRARLSAAARAKAEQQRHELRAKERFAQTRRLFNVAEADVFRQGDNVLIRLKGFGFKPGKHNVAANNYALLNKVVAAINTFPESSVQISGHTDTRGNSRRNHQLSAARAQSVVGFLSTVGGVGVSRLSADGKGSEQPVASNKTAEGRAKNRRIDLLIVNDGPAMGNVSRATP